MSIVLVSCVLFGLGLYGILTRRDLVGVLASIEVLVGAPMLLLVGLSATVGGADRVQGSALLLIVLMVAEAAVGFALVVAAARRSGTTLTEEMTEVRG